jgi:hypothetical protein
MKIFYLFILVIISAQSFVFANQLSIDANRVIGLANSKTVTNNYNGGITAAGGITANYFYDNSRAYGYFHQRAVTLNSVLITGNVCLITLNAVTQEATLNVSLGPTGNIVMGKTGIYKVRVWCKISTTTASYIATVLAGISVNDASIISPTRYVQHSNSAAYSFLILEHVGLFNLNDWFNLRWTSPNGTGSGINVVFSDLCIAVEKL